MDRLREAVQSILDKASAIPYSWGAVKMPRQNYLFQQVAVFNEQIKREKDGSGYLFQKPAFFLEVLNSEPRPLMSGVSETEQTWRVHIVAQEFDATDGTLDQNLSIFEYRALVKTWLKSFTPTNCGAFIDSGEQQDRSHTGVYVYILDFKNTFIDVSGSPYDPNTPFYTTYQGTPQIDLIEEITITSNLDS